MTDRASRPPIPTLVAAGRARIPATAVIRGGRLVNVVSAEIYPADVAVYQNTVVAIGDVSAHVGPDTKIVEAEGRHLVPGLFDGHMHIECSKLSVTGAAKMLPGRSCPATPAAACASTTRATTRTSASRSSATACMW